MRRQIAVTLVALGTLTACSGVPAPSMSAFGTVPPPGTVEMLEAVGTGDVYRQQIMAHLAMHGFRSGKRATYIAQFTLSEVPGRTGLFAPSGAPYAETHWLIPPSSSRSIRLRVATLTISDRATGQETFKILVSEAVGRKKPPPEDQFVELLLAKLDAAMTKIAATPS